MKFRKKPVVIEAVKMQLAEMTANGPEHGVFAEIPDWLREAMESGKIRRTHKGGRDYVVLEISTLEGVMECTPGDWLIQGVKGEIYPCKPDIFQATYEMVEGDTG